MSTEERLRALRATRELRRLSDAQLRALLPHLDELRVAAGTQLALEGRLCHQFLVVAAGSLETCRHGRAATMGPGGAFGWQAMRERGVNDATVKAVSAAHLLAMSHEQFRAVDGLLTRATNHSPHHRVVLHVEMDDRHAQEEHR